MYVFPGKALNALVQFKLGDDPASPSLAAYVVSDGTTDIVPSTPITVNPGETEAWINIPGSANTLLPDEKYKQLRIEVSYVIDGLSFDNYLSYFVVPDLFLDYGIRQVRTLFGSSDIELNDSDIDFYRSYIDLSNSAIGDDFLAALLGTEPQRKLAAKQLVFWYTMQTLLPSVRMNMLKSVESETSKMTRMATSTNFDAIADLIKERYALYLSLISASGTTSSPAFIVLDAPVDAITGA